MRFLTLLALICLPTGGAAFAAAAPIIDMHLHAFGFDEYGYLAPPNEITGRIPNFGSDESAMQATINAIRKAGVVRGLSPASPELDPYWVLAKDFDLPAAIHTGLGDSGTPFGLYNYSMQRSALVVTPQLIANGRYHI